MQNYNWLFWVVFFCTLLIGCGGDDASDQTQTSTNSASDLPSDTNNNSQNNDDNSPKDDEIISSASTAVLYFSDLTVGPRTGNSDTSKGQIPNEHGAIVSIYGRNLSGDAKVYIGGVEAQTIYYSGEAEPPYSPANLYKSHQMEMIIFQIPATAALGDTTIQVEVNDTLSNSLDFHIRDSGNIYFIDQTGNGYGSFDSPFSDITNIAANKLIPGDIVYIRDGVSVTEINGDYDSIINLAAHGTVDLPIAMVAYPGAEVDIGRADHGRTIHNWVIAGSDNYANAYTIAKMKLTSSGCTVSVSDYTRIVGNYFTAPQGTGATGVVCQIDAANYARVYGNEFYDVGAPDAHKLYHVVYLSSKRNDSGSREPLETDRIVAYNYFHDNRANRAIDFYSEDPNFSTDSDATAFASNNKIHDNYIYNQGGDGILLGWYMTGENWIYNNVIINSGRHLDDWGFTGHSGISLDKAGHDEVASTTIHIYNNTIYGGGWVDFPGYYGSLYISEDARNRINVMMKNNIFYSTGDVYFAGDAENLPIDSYNNLYFGHSDVPENDSDAYSFDPMFIDIDIGDARLDPNSPALDKGVDIIDVERGFLGNPRLLGTYDLGAYEKR